MTPLLTLVTLTQRPRRLIIMLNLQVQFLHRRNRLANLGLVVVAQVTHLVVILALARAIPHPNLALASAAGYTPGEQGCQKHAGHPSESPVLLDGVVDRHRRSEHAEQAASQQEESYDPRSVFRLSSGVICWFHGDSVLPSLPDHAGEGYDSTGVDGNTLRTRT